MKINSVNLNVLAVRRSQYPTDNKPEFLLVGRSNVGKSSFINTMINRKNYAKTSSNPGKTQTINFYLVNDEFYLVDAPGYGYANLSTTLFGQDDLHNPQLIQLVSSTTGCIQPNSSSFILMQPRLQAFTQA